MMTIFERLADFLLSPLRSQIELTMRQHENPTRAELNAMQPFRALVLGAANDDRASRAGDLYRFAGAILNVIVSDRRAVITDAATRVISYGVPSEIIATQIAHSTPGEIAKFAATYGDELPVVIVTHDWHKHRAAWLAERAGLTKVVFFCVFTRHDGRVQRVKLRQEARRLFSNWIGR